MSGTDQNTPAAKPGRRSRKAAPRNPKPERPPSPQADQLQAAEQPIAATAAPADIAPAETAAAADAAPIEPTPVPAETTPAEAAVAADATPVEAAAARDTAPIEAAPADTPTSEDVTAPADPAPVSLQAIAKAYGDYTRKSLEETRSYVEKLRDVRSLDKAVEVQAEFTKHAFELFVTGSRTIYGLHKELAKQTLKPLERLVDKPKRDVR